MMVTRVDFVKCQVEVFFRKKTSRLFHRSRGLILFGDMIHEKVDITERMQCLGRGAEEWLVEKESSRSVEALFHARNVLLVRRRKFITKQSVSPKRNP